MLSYYIVKNHLANNSISWHRLLRRSVQGSVILLSKIGNYKFTKQSNPISNSLMANSEATFKVKAAFQVTGRQFFLLGDILSGVIKIGMIADLSSGGVDKRLSIEAIEFALHRDDNKVWEDAGLGFSGLTETEKELLKVQTPFIISFGTDEIYRS